MRYLTTIIFIILIFWGIMFISEQFLISIGKNIETISEFFRTSIKIVALFLSFVIVNEILEKNKDF